MTRSPSTTTPQPAGLSGSVWVGLFLVGLIVRLIILTQVSAVGPRIVDEQHYTQLAGNLLAGNGFGWAPGELTSIRPPLYPGLLAAVWGLFGDHNLLAVRIVQLVLSIALSGVVYALGKRLYGARTGQIAALVCWLYPSLVFFDFLMLTETLFTVLLLLFLLLVVRLVQEPGAVNALACGLALGLAALTRSVLWPVPVLLCPLLALLIPGPIARRLVLPALVLVGFAAPVVPWAIRNTRLQEVTTIVDTMGGINLRMGNYEFTPDDRMWDAVSIKGQQNWVYGFTTDEPGQRPTEGRKDKWAQRTALEYMRANPGITIKRAFIKFADFWGIEREFLAGVSAGLYRPAPWVQIVGSVLIAGGYVVLALAGAAGLWLAAPTDWRLHVLMLFPIAVIMGAHTLVFAHSRYHVPLMPILALYAAQLGVRWPPRWQASRLATAGAAMTVGILAIIWTREVLVVEAARLSAIGERWF